MRQMRHWAILAVVLFALISGSHARADSKFLWISDLHFNPMADAALVGELEKAEPARWEAILDRTSPQSFSQYGTDTNWWLLKSSLAQFPKTIRHPAFVMVTGDLLAHNFPATFQSATHDSDPAALPRVRAEDGGVSGAGAAAEIPADEDPADSREQRQRLRRLHNRGRRRVPAQYGGGGAATGGRRRRVYGELGVVGELQRARIRRLLARESSR